MRLVRQNKIAAIFLWIVFILALNITEESLAGIAEDPLSIDNLTCGQYQVAGQLQTLPTGQDVLVFYPGTNREFSVPLRGLKAHESLDFQKAMAIYQVVLPEVDGKKQGYFYFQNLIKGATQSEVFQRPLQKTGSSCKMPGN